MDAASRRQLRDTLRSLLEPVIARLGCELVAIELAGSSRRPTLRLYVDRAGGVGVDHCAAVSRAVSPVLDVADPFPAAYELEVSSPGIERPVERPQDFVRFAGYRAKVRVAEPEGQRRTLSGVLRGLDGDLLCLEVGGELHRLPLADVDKVRLDLTLEEFERLGRPSDIGEDAPPNPAEGA